MLLYSHSACLAHQPGPGHPESPDRLRAVLDALGAIGLVARDAPEASREQLAQVHTAEHVDRLFALAGKTAQLDADTVMSAQSLAAALRAAGAVCAAIDELFGGTDQRAFCAVRPPGHHATADTAMGFCLFNNIAIGAAHAMAKHGLERIAIADFDVHHGNGSAAIFADDPRVLYLSSHQRPLYPETGEPGRHGNAVNAGLAANSPPAAFRLAWRDRLLPVLEYFQPQLVLVSAGFDADRRDPLASLQLGADDYRWITAELCAIADRHSEGRLVSVLEGGYDLQALAEDSVAHVKAMCA